MNNNVHAIGPLALWLNSILVKQIVVQRGVPLQGFQAA